MKKIAIAFLLVGIFCVTGIFAQTSKKTRPRVVKTPTSTTQKKTETQTRKPPVLINDTNSSKSGRKPPVLINDGPSKAPTDNTTKVINDVIEDDDDDEIKIDTNYVTLPVSVLDRNGRFVAGLSQRDFKIFENGIEQKVEYFASVEKPFTVVLLIDVSPSTAYKIDEIHRAAIAFVRQLRNDDKVMVVAFDENYSILTRPTNDRYQLERAIRRAKFGGGTSIYEAVSRTINQELRYIEGRKAIVLFTDGVDTTSKRANYETTLREVEEVDALIYPIRYNTFRSYTGNRGGNNRNKGVLGTIIEKIITGGVSGGNSGGGASGTSAEEYRIGKEYLTELARYSGGRKFEADTTKNLDSAFRSIAEELRKQYSLGYYPDTGQKGERRRIRVRVMRRNLVVRTKNSYIVGEGT